MIDFENELRKFAFQDFDKDFISVRDDAGLLAAAIKSTVTKFNKKQSQLEMQLEDISSILEDGQASNDCEAELKRSVNDLVKALVTVADTVEDFWVFTKKSNDKQLLTQSTLMWNIVVKALASAGVMCINDVNTPFNGAINTAVETVVSNIPDGFIAEVMRSGYIYNGNIVRKSNVLVSKGEL